MGSNIKEWKYPHTGDTRCWSMSSYKYVNDAIKVVELELHKVNKRLKTKVKTPMDSRYRPELDTTPELNPERHQYFQNLIGVLRWAVELGRIDIAVNVSLLSTYLASPREGHLDQALHIFSYLKHHNRSTLVFDPKYPMYDPNLFQEHDWGGIYKYAKEQKPLNAPEPLGQAPSMSAFIDSDHAGNQVTRRSQTGIIIFLCMAPIIWFSKRQNTVETSSFGSEFIALRTGVEMIESLRYKLRMFGVSLYKHNGETHIYCDNAATVKNSTHVESTLNKKHT